LILKQLEGGSFRIVHHPALFQHVHSDREVTPVWKQLQFREKDLLITSNRVASKREFIN